MHRRQQEIDLSRKRLRPRWNKVQPGGNLNARPCPAGVSPMGTKGHMSKLVPTAEHETATASREVDDYTQGLRVERALARLEAIPDPIARAHAARHLADQAREVQGDIARIRRQAIYEATLRPGHTGESVAAELQVTPKAVSNAVSEFRAQDRQLFHTALKILMKNGVTTIPAERLTPGLRARDVLVQARLVLLGLENYDPREVTNEEFGQLEDAGQRARKIHKSIGEEVAPTRWHRRTRGEAKIDWEQVPQGMINAARVFDALPGIAPLFFDLPNMDSATPSTSNLWRIGWSILPAEDGVSLFAAGPHRDGWVVTEYLVWFIHDLIRSDVRIWKDMYSPPPYLNGPGECLYFMVEGELHGEKAITPDRFVKDLKDFWVDHHTGPVDVNWPDLSSIDDQLAPEAADED